MPLKRIVVLISGSGSNLQAIMDAIESGRIHGQIVQVISNKTDAYGLVRAANAGIPTTCIDHKTFASREAFDDEVRRCIDINQADLIILAGFMRILSARFVQHFSGRMLNIHPSLLPKYKGLHTHQRALAANDLEHGCTVHYVTEELDGGPLLIQAVVPILQNDDENSLQSRVHTREHAAYPLAVEWICAGRVRFDKDGIHLDEELLPDSGFRLGYDT
ncbi:phosphoribosylglycinamide formyltransferase [Neptunomonas japonica]|uniref:Phosphoribosylglycinamide formyltransferase n=1 Tax=Neptunomonas japonica JAMM 1380 TaxID=1441457 RepID=A0A7R6SVX9_9GAMM|nr:phosphoribosylglycinamide formyltransferase [Neptunomonas japonica]BBB30074.1 phosphoribosylglycinamide formyltransferase 1 [Neptunomonas japonica JAMM 1380]